MNLRAAAFVLGVARIEERNLLEDGRTEWTNGVPIIALRKDRPVTRKRFTLAHELGHVLLERGEPAVVAARTRSLEPPDTEVLCDRIAAAILMPRNWIARLSDRNRVTLSLLRLIGSHAAVSMAAAAVRVTDVSGRPCMLLRWRRTAGGWILMAMAGVPKAMIGLIKLTDEDQAILDTIPRRDLWRRMTLILENGKVATGDAHVSRWGDTCMTLFSQLSHKSETKPLRPARAARSPLAGAG